MKKVKFSVGWEMYGYQTVGVPDDIAKDKERLIEYLQDNLDHIPLPEGGEYVISSARVDPEGILEIEGPHKGPSTEDVLNKAARKGARLHFIQPFDTDKLHSLWFGGRVAEIEYKGYTFILGAYGEIRLIIKDRNTGEELEDFKNKGNCGGISELSWMIHDDSELDALITDNDLQKTMIVDNNNWWEVLIDTPSGEHLDFGWVTNDDGLLESINEVLDNMEAVIRDYEQFYC